MPDPNTDARVRGYLRWLALSRWENEGGAGNDPELPDRVTLLEHADETPPTKRAGD